MDMEMPYTLKNNIVDLNTKGFSIIDDVLPLDMANNAKAGLALSFEKDKIREIQFCFSLMTTENNYFFNDYSKAYQADWKEEKHVRFIDKPEIIENLWREKYWWVNDEYSLKY